MADHRDRTEALARALTPPLREALGDAGVEVSDLRRLSGGASRETWSFTAVGPSAGPRRLVLQRLRPGGVGTGPSMAVEDRLLAAAEAAGVPVPPVVVDAPAAEGAGLGQARVSAHVDGEALGPRIVRAERTDEGRRALGRRLGSALAGIHAIDPEVVADLDVVDPLGRVRDGLDLLGEQRPALELGLRRLEATRPEPGPVGVVHGDYRVGNLLVDGDELTAVLDWELAHRGDPAEDLGWLCGRAWRFGGDREAGGVADLDDVLAGYVEAGGRPTSPEVVRWWTAAGTLLWGLICAVQARRHLDGHVRSVELATIGRRVCEAEHDLLELVLDPLPRPPRATPPTPRPRRTCTAGRPRPSWSTPSAATWPTTWGPRSTARPASTPGSPPTPSR
ncbi:phosphotransferase family protein [Iamia majanohamensis]|uniref:Phosphotransferase family protein n=1 Tax=Iamia majanohamensis TaxID=467976 RepID=A0AAE9YJ14_9ACTN|nr:phosphotransferase family protein [Iamia majanohamensis]WCO68966.1 phosphotransferase family protein [Iamia majanohamensis]